MGAGAAAGEHDGVDAQAGRFRLPDEFGRRVGVAARADGVRAAARNGVDPVRAAGQAGDQFVERGLHVVARRAAMDDGAAQPVEQHVAVFVVVRIGKARPVFQQDVAFQAEAGRGGGGLARVVGLDRALGRDRFGPALQRGAHQEFQLARLVAAGREARAVVALDPDFRPAPRSGKRSGKRRAQPFERLQRRRQMGEAHPREVVEVHGVPSGAASVPRSAGRRRTRFESPPIPFPPTVVRARRRWNRCLRGPMSIILADAAARSGREPPPPSRERPRRPTGPRPSGSATSRCGRSGSVLS